MEVSSICAVFSIFCCTAVFGSMELLKPEKTDRFWIDFNYTSKSVSLLCNYKKSASNRIQILINIKIGQLKIHNQVDCVVISSEPATFSAEVPAELKNARIAVFTLSTDQMGRLKENRNLLDFYNYSNAYSHSETDNPKTPNTIEQYLAEDNLEDESELSDAIKAAKSLLPNPVVMLQKLNLQTVPEKKSTPTVKGKKVIRKLSEDSSSMMTANFLTKSNTTKKEGGYSTGVSTVKKDATIFKKPTKPVRQLVKKHKTPPEMSANPMKHIKSIPNQQPESDEIQTQKTTPKNTKVVARRRQSAVNSGIGPETKQVNTVTPMKHTKDPTCDLMQANANVSHIQSNVGASCLNEPPNINTTPEMLLYNQIDSDNDSIWGPTKTRNKRRNRRPHFVPYSVWKVKQNAKRNGQQEKKKRVVVKKKKKEEAPKRMISVLSVFDTLKVSEPNGPSTSRANKLTQKTVFADDEFSSSSSNHNFEIGESDNEVVVAETSDAELSLDGMVCRTEPEHFDQRTVTIPVELPSQISSRNNFSEDSYQVSESFSNNDQIQPTRFTIDHNTSLISTNREGEEQVQGISPRSIYSEEEIIMDSQDRRPSNSTMISGVVHTDSEQHADSRDKWYVDRYLKELSGTPDISPVCFDSMPENDPQLQVIANSEDDESHVSMDHTTIPDIVHSDSEQHDTLNRRPEFNEEKVTIIQNQIIMSTVRKRSFPGDNETGQLAKMRKSSLNGYSDMFPRYMELIVKEKDRLITEQVLKHEIYLKDSQKAIQASMKSIAENEAKIDEIIENLSFLYGKLDWLFENIQKNKSIILEKEIEEKELIQDIDEDYRNIADQLDQYGATISAELWQNFSQRVIRSIGNRLSILSSL